MNISEELAEIWGLHAGDGTIYATTKGTVWELRSNNDEKEFYDNHIIPLLKKVYSHKFIGKYRNGGKKGCYGVCCCQKAFHSLILIGEFPIGTKTRTVHIPSQIIQGTTTIKQAFLRGLFAADGCVYTYKKYPTIQFASASFQLIEEVSQLLDEMQFQHSRWKSESKKGGIVEKIRISGKERCKRFSKEIGLTNTKQYKKLKDNI